MEPHRFDGFTRTLARTGARRWVLRLVVALPLGGVSRLLEEETRARPRRHQSRHHRANRHAHLHDQKKKKKKKRPSCAQTGQTASPGQSCCAGLVLNAAGQCVQPAPAICADSCPGCCNEETCESGASATSCGASGTPCADCSGLHGICFNGACRCAVCPSGCPYASVQAAVADPAGPTTIHVCAGTYVGNVVIGRNVTIIGTGDSAGAGNAILQGTGSGSVVTINSGRSVSLQDLRITGGNALVGGGILTQSGALTMTRCTVTGNSVVGDGGGILTQFSALTLSQCTITGNSANNGGGISHVGGTMTLDASHVTNNSASGGGGLSAGQTIPSGSITLQNGSTVANNTASSSGGGIASLCPITLLSRSSVTENHAPNGAGVISGSTLLVNNSDIRNNVASEFGGGIYNLNGVPGLVGAVILRNGAAVAGNTASATLGRGGGIFNQGTVDPSGGSITSNFPDQCVNDTSAGAGTGCP